MTKDFLHKIISQGESETIEFKSSFNVGVIESLVAFSNTKGGTIFIGIDEKGVIKGVSLQSETIPQWMNEIR